MDNQFVLRRANIFDIEALAELCQKTFRETFVEDFAISYPENDLDSLFRSSANSEWFATKINDAQQAVWIIEDQINGQLVAYTVVGPSDPMPHPDNCPNKDGMLRRLFVRRDQRNRGFGRQLMNVVLVWLEEHFPERSIWLSVWSRNVKAQKFYAHYGFNKVGQYELSIGESKNHEFIMKRHTVTS